MRQASNVKGIDIVPGKTAKLASYAYDTTIFVKDDQSIYILFNLLDKFESVSGLRISQSKSELLWLGSIRLHKGKIFNLKLSTGRANILPRNIFLRVRPGPTALKNRSRFSFHCSHKSK